MSDFWTWLMSTIPPAADPDPLAMTTGETITCVWVLSAMTVAFVQWRWIASLKQRIRDWEAWGDAKAEEERLLGDKGYVQQDDGVLEIPN